MQRPGAPSWEIDDEEDKSPLLEYCEQYLFGSDQFLAVKRFAPAAAAAVDDTGGAGSEGGRGVSALERAFSLGVALPGGGEAGEGEKKAPASVATAVLATAAEDSFSLSPEDLSEAHRRQLFSFAVAKTLGRSKLTLEEQGGLLHTTNTTDRLRRCEQVLQEGSSWLKARKALERLMF